jgi:uncharacterized protein YceH (UPF0502 family)
MRHPLVLLLLLLAPPAMAIDEFVPFTDGRLGGCYRTDGGELYNCTRNPGRAGSEKHDKYPDKDAATPAADAGIDPATADGVATRAEIEALRRELEALRQERDEELAVRAAAREKREEVRRAAQAEVQAEEDAAMAAYNAIEGAKDSARLEQLQQQTEACRRTLEKRGYRIVGAGACRAPDGSYVNCPAC